jgi:hypothetical protein
VPLFALALVRLGRRWRGAAAVLVCLVLGLNAFSLASADPRLNLPTSAAGSTAANRAELLALLESNGPREIYTDYWLAYPLMFESQERVLASVSSGGYNRFAPYAYFVSVSEAPGFVFIAGSPEQAEFERRLAAAGGAARRETVSIYEVYSAVAPLERLRP